MKSTFYISLGMLALSFLISGCRRGAKEHDVSIKEPIEWSRTWAPSTDKSDLPRVLIIGDSHVERYYPLVAKKLEGAAYCAKLATSKSLGDPVLLEEIDLMLRQYDFSVISFNNGLHGKGYSEEQYGAFVPRVFALFRKRSKAKVIWVNTTPVRKRGKLSEFGEFTLRVRERNRIVREYAEAHGIPIVDLFSLGERHEEYYTDDGVHFNSLGVEAEAERVAAAIRALLPDSRKEEG